MQNTTKKHGSKLEAIGFYIYSYAPHFISTVVLCGAITMFLSPSSGLLGMTINNVRAMMGLEEINLLYSGSSFKWIYVLSGIWQGTGWGSVIYFAALSGVDPQLSEAAKVDGAKRVAWWL